MKNLLEVTQTTKDLLTQELEALTGTKLEIHITVRKVPTELMKLCEPAKVQTDIFKIYFPEPGISFWSNAINTDWSKSDNILSDGK
jgi:hypothetical protein